MSLFDWDEENSTHIASHGVSCAEAQQVINNEPFDVELQAVKDEERFVQLGETNAGRILVVVTTWRGSLIRVITGIRCTQGDEGFLPHREGKFVWNRPSRSLSLRRKARRPVGGLKIRVNWHIYSTEQQLQAN
jgi:uncharacterized DUF497 family protein